MKSLKQVTLRRTKANQKLTALKSYLATLLDDDRREAAAVLADIRVLEVELELLTWFIGSSQDFDYDREFTD